MKQQQFDLLFATDLHQLFLRAVLGPGRRRSARVLGRVGITDHDFLRAVQTRTIARQAEQLLDHRPGVVEVSQGLEQRHHTHRPLQPGFLEQQLHGQHVGCRTCHRNDVRAQRRCRSCCHYPAGCQHFCGVGCRFEVAWQQRPAVVQFAQQKVDAGLLVPLFVATQPQIIGNFSHRRTVATGVLADIQTHQKQAERDGTAQAIQKRPVGNHAHAALMQRLEAQQQRVQQLAVVSQHRFRRRQGLAQ